MRISPGDRRILPRCQLAAPQVGTFRRVDPFTWLPAAGLPALRNQE